jgi:hypothetical protein
VRKFCWLISMAVAACGTSPKAKPADQNYTQTHGTFPVPHATGEHPEPIWFAHPYWDQYEMPGFWQCPVGYVQEIERSAFSPSLHGEISGGSEDHSRKPTCRLPKKGEFERGEPHP